MSKINYDIIDIHRVTVLPPTFNGDVIFELRAVDTFVIQSQARHLSGMDKRHDAHVRSKTMTTNITNHVGLTFHTSVCVGHLRCSNIECEFLRRVHRTYSVNELEWEGLSPSALSVGVPHPKGSTLVCKICKDPPLCISMCSARVYYVLGAPGMTRTYVHLGIHAHPVKDGELRDMQDRTRVLIGEQMEKTPTATNSSIVLEATKELLGELLLTQDGVKPTPLDFDDLVPVLDKCKYFSSPSI